MFVYDPLIQLLWQVSLGSPEGVKSRSCGVLAQYSVSESGCIDPDFLRHGAQELMFSCRSRV